jgi:hypothetical protein
MLPWWVYPAACCVLFGGGAGWVLGYMHRDFIEWGRQCARLLPHDPLGLLIRAYRELWADIAHLAATGQLRPGRLAKPRKAPENPGPFVVCDATAADPRAAS